MLINEILNERTHQYYPIPMNNHYHHQLSFRNSKNNLQYRFNSTSHAKPQTPFCPISSTFQVPSHPHGLISSTNNSNLSSLNNDTYSGFFSPSSLSQSEFDENLILTREETKLIPKQKVGRCSGECTICFETYKKSQIIRNLPCGHKFHYKCMKPWLKTSSFCPLCRFDLKTYCQDKMNSMKQSVQTHERLDEEIEMEIKEEQVNLNENHLIKKIDTPHSQTFVEMDSLNDEQAFLNQSIAISAIEFKNSEEKIAANLLRNEQELRYRVMGFETESNVSFFGKKEETQDINFGIEDNISEIGF
jgi:hypothetical protein